MSPEVLVLGLLWYVVFLFSTTAHEAAHALAAYRLGDPTAYHGGQVSLNPLPHIAREPFGTVLVPLISFAISGWMMGWASAPYDPYWADRHPRRAAWMALAGPASNLVLVLVAAIAVHVGIALGVFVPPDAAGLTTLVAAADPGGAWTGPATFLSITFSLNLLLFAFNLMPLPPLDGSAALPLVLSESAAAAWQQTMRQPMFSLLGLLAAWRLFGEIFGPLFRLALNLLYPGVGYG
ncbi:MAG: site-2 protease family protein [Acidobacteriota bacterium]